MTDPIQAIADSLAVLADLSDVGGVSAVVAGVPCLSVPEIPDEWAAQARAVLSPDPPSATVVVEVCEWLAAHAPQWTFMVRAEHAPRLPGFTLNYLMRGLRVAHISGVAVPPAHAGQGIGSAVSAAATRLARSVADLVWLHSTAQAEPIYQRLGFRHVTDHAQLVPRG